MVRFFVRFIVVVGCGGVERKKDSRCLVMMVMAGDGYFRQNWRAVKAVCQIGVPDGCDFDLVS